MNKVTTLLALFLAIQSSNPTFATGNESSKKKTEKGACCQQGTTAAKACCSAQAQAEAAATGKPCTADKTKCAKEAAHTCPKEAAGQKCCSGSHAENQKCNHPEVKGH